jgi:hypothetical protein
MYKLSFFFLAALIITITFGCGNSQNNKQSENNSINEIYKDIGNWDQFNVPLSQPYVLINNQQEKNTWLVNMYDKSKRFQFSITPLEKVCIINKYILIKGGGKYGETAFYGEVVKNIWFIINSEKKEEIGFDDSVTFYKYIGNLQIENLKWYDANDLYDFTKKNKKLPW